MGIQPAYLNIYQYPALMTAMENDKADKEKMKTYLTNFLYPALMTAIESHKADKKKVETCPANLKRSSFSLNTKTRYFSLKSSEKIYLTNFLYPALMTAIESDKADEKKVETCPANLKILGLNSSINI